MKPHLIYDWNKIGAAAPPPVVMLDDETLRDGLQSPSVSAPTIDQKIRILHLIDELGIDSADIGLPGAGPHVVKDVEVLAREIASAKLKVRANCAARTHVNDIAPIVDIVQRTGVPIECCAFIGSSSMNPTGFIFHAGLARISRTSNRPYPPAPYTSTRRSRRFRDEATWFIVLNDARVPRMASVSNNPSRTRTTREEP